MALWDDAECEECGELIKDGERVIVSTVTGGYFNETEGTVSFDDCDIENAIRHKKCWMNKPDEQLPEKPCDDGSIAVPS